MFAEWRGSDPVIDISGHPNRPDCMGVYGVARDLAAAGWGHWKAIDAAPVAGPFLPDRHRDARSGRLPGLYGRVIRGVKNGPSPQWLQDWLTAAGQRPISALVDCTNYVMLARPPGPCL